VLGGCLRGAWDFGGAGSYYAPYLRVLDLRCFLDAYRYFFLDFSSEGKKQREIVSVFCGVILLLKQITTTYNFQCIFYSHRH
jgi:hypothetical protein